MIKSIHAEKVFGKIHYSIMIKTLWKIGIKNFLNLVKSICNTPEVTLHLIIQDWILSPYIRNKASMSTLTTVIQHSIRVLASEMR